MSSRRVSSASPFLPFFQFLPPFPAARQTPNKQAVESTGGGFRSGKKAGVAKALQRTFLAGHLREEKQTLRRINGAREMSGTTRTIKTLTSLG